MQVRKDNEHALTVIWTMFVPKYEYIEVSVRLQPEKYTYKLHSRDIWNYLRSYILADPKAKEIRFGWYHPQPPEVFLPKLSEMVEVECGESLRKFLKNDRATMVCSIPNNSFYMDTGDSIATTTTISWALTHNELTRRDHNV